MIRVLWSDNICLFSKKVNKYNLYNSKVSIYEKCCTFEGPECFSNDSNINTIIIKYIIINY